jgi:hypothetical protein
MRRRTALLAGIALLAIAPHASSAGAPTPLDARGLVLTLADPSCDGRAPGTPGLDKAAEIVAGALDNAGLEPAGDQGTWFQPFTPEPSAAPPAGVPAIPKGTVLRNVVGILPGSGDGFVVIGAHYDHLGRDRDGALYAGADDNASGVAVLILAARELVADPSPHRRSILFVSWSGEEEGLLGSQWYVAHPLRPLASTIAMINMDTVGRMENNRLIILNASSAAELAPALRGVDLAFGLDLAIPEKGPFGSDQLSFIEKGIPAVQLFTGANADYHRPTDTPEKLDYAGIVTIASYTAELARFLADRDAPLTFVSPAKEIEATEAARAAGGPTPSGRRASLGTIPDFSGADAEPGVPISGVLPGSPADKAGLKGGDRLTAMDGERLSGIEDFTAALKAHAPGDTVRVTFVRAGKEETVVAVLGERK